MSSIAQKPLALIVFLENGGAIHGLSLPPWVSLCIDFLSEAYAKALLRLYGAYQHYERVHILEDARATPEQLRHSLTELSGSYRIDLFLLVHGLRGGLAGYRGAVVGQPTFEALKEETLELRAVYGLNCYGQSLAETWHALGAEAVAGPPGVNWFPEPGLSGFLRAWLRGESFFSAAQTSNRAVRWIGKRLLGEAHVAVTSSLLLSSGRDLRLKD